MEQKIKSQLNGRKPNEIKKLALEYCQSTSIVGLTEDFTSLVKLSMGDIGLASLDGLPRLPSLKHLDLSDNVISEGLENLLKCPNLIGIDLSKNAISKLESLQPLSELRNLKAIDIHENDFNINEEDFSYEIFQMIPSLVYVDDSDRKGEDGDPRELRAYMEGDDDKPSNVVNQNTKGDDNETSDDDTDDEYVGGDDNEDDKEVKDDNGNDEDDDDDEPEEEDDDDDYGDDNNED